MAAPRARVLWFIVGVNLFVRGFWIWLLPLILTNDSQGYIAWGLDLLSGQPFSIPWYRTPGYPLFLAGVFSVGGVNPAAVLISQHALACVAAVCMTDAAFRLAGRPAAILAGLGVTLDPYLLMSQSYALSEAAMIPLICIAASAAVNPRRPVPAAIVVGVAGASASLCRPAAQVLVPFLILACALAPRAALGRRALALAAGFACVVIVLAPWFAFNARRGLQGLAGGTGVVVFSNLARVGMPRVEHAPTDLGQAFAAYEGRSLTEAELWEFLHAVGAFDDRDADRRLWIWAKRTMRAEPAMYGTMIFHALVWQHNVYPAGWGYRFSELNWFLWRLGVDGLSLGQRASNFQVTSPEPMLNAFAQRHRAPADLFAHAAARWPRGVPQIPIALSMIAACGIAVHRRKWALATVLLGAGAFIAFHAMLVFPFARYSLPAHAIGYLALGVVGEAIGRAAGQRRRQGLARHPTNDAATS